MYREREFVVGREHYLVGASLVKGVVSLTIQESS